MIEDETVVKERSERLTNFCIPITPFVELETVSDGRISRVDDLYLRVQGAGLTGKC
jgi:hypothetical protein